MRRIMVHTTPFACALGALLALPALAADCVNGDTNGASCTIPAGIGSVTIEAWGGGGGGGGGNMDDVRGAAGGGGGSYCKATFAVTPGSALTITTGTGGAGGAAGPALLDSTDGMAGGYSSATGGGIDGMRANGGAGGPRPGTALLQNGAPGGSVDGCTAPAAVKHAGGSVLASQTPYTGLGGGGSATATSAGSSPNGRSGGTGAGVGGNGAHFPSSSSATQGASPGGGGGGGAPNYPGADGGGGRVVLTLNLAPATDGACGSANGQQPLLVLPAGAVACSAGTFSSSSVTGGTFNWSCAGSNGGAAASCQAPQGASVTASVGAGGTFNPTGQQIVASGGSATFSLSANTGYVIDQPSGDCNGAFTSGTVGASTASYQTSALTAGQSCTVTFNFISANAAPTASGVSVTGTPRMGQTLTGSYTYADANGDPQGTSVLQWIRGSTAIPGASGSQYTPVVADAGQTLSFCVTPVATTGQTPGTQVCSTPTAPVGADGACGAAVGQAMALAPKAGLCSMGTPSAVNVSGGQYSWVCQGQNGGAASSTCQAPWVGTGGSRSATVAVQSTNNWQVNSASFSATPPPGVTAPPNATFPAGVLTLNLNSGTAGSDATVTLQFSSPIPSGAVYMKYGPSPDGFNCQGTSACAQPHWYELPSTRAVLATDRLSATLTLTDGGLGDHDGAANQFIQDPGGFVLMGTPAGAQTIPTLSEWGVALMSLLVMALAAVHMFFAVRVRG